MKMNCIFRGVIWFSVLLCLAFLPSCRNNKKSTDKEIVVSADAPDSTSLFNGLDLKGWEITNFGPQGPVEVSAGKIILGMGDGCTGITWKRSFPEISYEVNLDAMRVSGNDFFCGMTFRVGKYPCTLIVGGWGGGTVGLSSINGRDASENETTSIRNFENNKWYHIRLVVRENSIESWIDTTKIVDFTIDNKKLSIRPEVELSKPFGIASWKTTAAIKNIHLTGV